MKKQKVVRTFPNTYTNSLINLHHLLDDGWIVVMCNKFVAELGKEGNEYILEKEIEE